MEVFDRTTPAGAVAYFRNCIKTGNVEGATGCFDEHGVYIDRDGSEMRGLKQIKAAMTYLCTWRPEVRGGRAHVTLLGDMAVWLDKWEMTGETPDGSLVRMAGHTTCLMKRNEAGTWLWLVDNPFGAAVLEV